MILGDKELTEKIIGAAIEVHRTLGGPGLREDVYKVALNWELRQLGLKSEMEAEVPIMYKGMDLSIKDHPLRIDILVEDRVVVECKSISKYNPIFAAQCLTYLRLSGRQTGLVINFGMETVLKGLERIINIPKDPLRGNTEHGVTEERGSSNTNSQLQPPCLRPPCFAEGDNRDGATAGLNPLRGNTENGVTEERDTGAAQSVAQSSPTKSPCLRPPCFAEGDDAHAKFIKDAVESGHYTPKTAEEFWQLHLRAATHANPLRGNAENGVTEKRDAGTRPPVEQSSPLQPPCLRPPCFAEGDNHSGQQ